jgi:TatD DNase family protein
MWFDSHCHLNLPGFDASPADVWTQARSGGVSRVFVPGTDPSEWSDSTVPSLPGVSTGVGLHPFTLEQWWHRGDMGRLDQTLDDLGHAAARFGHVAIGECGWDKPLARRCPTLSLEFQTAVVERHLRLAVDLNLPVVLHVVQAHGLALKTLERFTLPRGGVVHCFSGNAELVPLYCRMGFALGYGTQLLQSNVDKASKALSVTPRARILLETDAPWRSQRGGLPNSPLALIDVARAGARVLDVSLESLAELTFANATRVFGGQLPPKTPM